MDNVNSDASSVTATNAIIPTTEMIKVVAETAVDAKNDTKVEKHTCVLCKKDILDDKFFVRPEDKQKVMLKKYDDVDFYCEQCHKLVHTPIRIGKRIGRNENCICGKINPKTNKPFKFKNCCINLYTK